jgi:hypothetical protein
MVSQMSIWIRCASHVLLLLLVTSCTDRVQTGAAAVAQSSPLPTKIEKIHNDVRVIHVLVALCDNVNQGIVPVSAKLGNGQQPASNLYWGAAFGVKTFFSKSPQWSKLLDVENPGPSVLERVVFKHAGDGAILVADAYDGSRMKIAVDDFLTAASGNKLENLDVGGKTVQIFSGADLIAFVGHDGLMDFHYDKSIVKNGYITQDAIILACASKQYFSPVLKKTGATPLLWTTNLMAPEAYILHDALEGWLKNETDEQIRKRAAAAYAKYQKINLNSAEGLFATGW